MKSWLLLCCLLLAPAWLGAQDLDVWTPDQVQKLAQLVREGQSFNEGKLYPSGAVQIAGFEVDEGATYIIDVRARLCFFKLRQSVTTVSCKAIKTGYPLFAPLITWDN